MGCSLLWRAVLLTVLIRGNAENVDNDVIIIANAGFFDTPGMIYTCVQRDYWACSRLELITTYPRFPVYDPVDDVIYWTDWHLNTICRASFSGDTYDNNWTRTDSNVFISPTTFFIGLGDLAIDPSMRLLFVTGRRLMKISLTTKVGTIILGETDIDSLTLDIDNRKIYYSNRRMMGVVNYDGSGQTTLYDISLSNRLAFVDADLLCVCSDRGLNSWNITTKTYELLKHSVRCKSVAVSGGKVYYADEHHGGKVIVTDQTYSNVIEISYGDIKGEKVDIAVGRRRYRECPSGTFGLNCSSKCGQCLNNDICDRENGKCPGNCASGWTDEKCDIKCAAGTFGLNCSLKCGHCLNNGICDSETGKCPGNCTSGWTDEKCSIECAAGTYGLNCSSKCGHCLNDDICDKETGKCPGNCTSGWTDEKCSIECAAGTYGLNCSSKCGHCLNNDICDKETGKCPGNCTSGWTDEKCETVTTCPASVVCSGQGALRRRQTQVGHVFYTDEICTDGKPLGSSACVEDGRGGPVWEPVRLNPTLNISVAQSELSKSLCEIIENYTETRQIEEMVNRMRNITRNRRLSMRDVLHITDFLEEISQLQRISAELATDVVQIINTVSESGPDVLNETDETRGVVNRLLLTLDTVTSKLDPGPSGHNRIRTGILESEIWDLRHENFTIPPIGLSLTESETGVTSSTVYNDTLDYSTTDSAIKLTQDFVHGVVNGSQGKSVRLSINFYRQPLLFRMKEERKIKRVISARLMVDGGAVTDLGGTLVTFTFKQDEVTNKAERICGYWNFTKEQWSTDGCKYTGVEDGRDVCVCDHLTNFAILLDVDGQYVAPGHLLAWRIITTIGVSMSVAGLFLTVVTFLIFRKHLKSEAPKTMFNMCLSQLCAWVVFLAGFNQTESYVGCIVSGVLLHYFTLASFLWMLAEALLYYLLLVKLYTSGAITLHYMWKTGVPAWVLPAVPVIAVLCVDPGLYRGRQSHCWMSWNTSLFSFTIPIGIIILCNAVFYGLIMFKIYNKGNIGQTKAKSRKRDMRNVRVSLVIFVLFGLSWVFGFLAVGGAKVVFQYIFCVTASTQGFLIFLLFTVRNKEIRKSWLTLCCRNTKWSRKYVLDTSKSTDNLDTSSKGTSATSVM